MAAGPTSPSPRDAQQRARPSRQASSSDDLLGAQDEERTYYGIEYIIIGLIFVAGFLLLKQRVVNLLEVFYHPFFILLIIVMAAEYIVLKARDRTYILERELAHLRQVRERQRIMLEETEQELDELGVALSARRAAGHPDSDILAQSTETIDLVLERLRERD